MSSLSHGLVLHLSNSTAVQKAVGLLIFDQIKDRHSNQILNLQIESSPNK